MTSVLDHKTQGGTGNIIHPIQENVPPRRLTRLEKARLEALEAFGHCGFDSIVVKKKDFRAKLQAPTSANKPLKRKNNDACEVSRSKKQVTCLGKLAVTETSDKVAGHNEKKRATRTPAASSRALVRPHSSLTSRKRMTRVEKARLEAMQSFDEQGLDAVWKSCTQIMSKTLEKKKGDVKSEPVDAQCVQSGVENHAEVSLTPPKACEETRNDEERSVEDERPFSKSIGVGSSEVVVCEAKSSATSQSSATHAVPETDRYHSDNNHGRKLTKVQKACMEALQSFAGQKFDEVIKTSTRKMAKYLTPRKNQATNTEPCEEQDSLSPQDEPSGHPKQRIDLFSNIQDTSFVDREALLSTSKRVLEVARDLETPSPQGSPGVL